MKFVKYRWNPDRMIWWASRNDKTIAVAKEICENGIAIPTASAPKPKPINRYVRKIPLTDYALKVKICDIVNADRAQLEEWEKLLKDYVNAIMSEDNSDHAGNSVSKSQESVRINCFN